MQQRVWALSSLHHLSTKLCIFIQSCLGDDETQRKHTIGTVFILLHQFHGLIEPEAVWLGGDGMVYIEVEEVFINNKQPCQYILIFPLSIKTLP